MPRTSVFAFMLWVAIVPAVSAQNNEDDSRTRVREAGDVVQIIIPVSALAATFIAKDKEGTFQFIKSFGFGVASVYVLKGGSAKLRPDASNRSSFPSGHTFAAFSGASFLGRRYGPKLGVPAYLAAGFVGYSRVQGQKHYLDDVIAGASIALFWNWRFTKPFHDNVTVEPMIGSDTYGVSLHASW